MDPDQLGQATLAAIIIVGAAVSYFQARRSKKQVQEVHVLVNNRSDQQDKRIAEQNQRIVALEGQLKEARHVEEVQ